MALGGKFFTVNLPAASFTKTVAKEMKTIVVKLANTFLYSVYIEFLLKPCRTHFIANWAFSSSSQFNTFQIISFICEKTN